MSALAIDDTAAATRRDPKILARDVNVFYGDTRVYVPVTNTNKDTRPFKLKVEYQGCADAGLCYPPIKKSFELNALPTLVAQTTSAKKDPPVVYEKADTATAQAATADTESGKAVTADEGEPLAEQDKLAKFLLEKPLWLSALFFFGLGLNRRATWPTRSRPW